MSFSVAEVAEWVGGRVVNASALGDRLGSIRVERPAPLKRAGRSEIAFFFSREYERDLLSAQPGILITGQPFVKPLEAAGLPLWNSAAVVVCDDPYYSMALISEKFASRLSSVAHLASQTSPRVSAHDFTDAFVHPTASLGQGVQVGPGCVIEKDARIGQGTLLYPGCYVGPSVEIGRDCVLFPRVTLYEWTKVGDRARIHAGAVLGADGFGYAPRAIEGKVVGHQKIYHLGRVVVGDDVEIGANSCVDRATFGETWIGNHVKLDNLVHIGHNASVDDGAIVCGGTCLAGGARLGKFTYIGGLTGITNNVRVGDGGKVGALSLVTKDVPEGGTAVGNPQREYREHFRAHAVLNRLAAGKDKKGRGE